MMFINKSNKFDPTRLLQAGAMSITLALTGCASAPTTVDNGQAVKQEEVIETLTDEQVDAKQANYQRLMAAPNLYKQNAITVPETAKAEIAAALAQKSAGDLDAASKSLKLLAVKYPNYSGLQLHLGDIALANNDEDLAKAYYQQAVAINKHNYYAYNRLGTLQRKQGDFIAAKASYQAALASWSSFAQAQLNLGILLDIYMGEKSEALGHYQTYYALTQEKDRKVKGWIADISAQLKAANNG